MSGTLVVLLCVMLVLSWGVGFGVGWAFAKDKYQFKGDPKQKVRDN